MAEETVAGDQLIDALLVRCSFPDKGDGPVTLAVSGGGDSLALLVLAARAGLTGTVVYVDHGLREGSRDESGFVEEHAERFGFHFEGRKVEVAEGPDLEARARRARYGVLTDGVLTGHTMDDQAETVLLNIVRGAALDGLAGMRSRSNEPDSSPAEGPARRHVVRPLLGIRRTEAAAVCAATGLTPLEDPSNLDLRFRRNRVRAEVIPLLCDVAGRDVVPILARQASLLADDSDLLEQMAAAIEPTDVRSLRAAPVPLARRALRRWLRSTGSNPDAELHPPSSQEIARILEVVAGTATACEVAGGRHIRRSRGRLTIVGR